MIVGFIGLGAMGLPMAKTSLREGLSSSQPFTRAASLQPNSRRSVPPLSKRPPRSLSVRRWVITVLPADEELEAVVLGGDGLLEKLKKGATLIDMTTATPQVLRASRACSQRGRREPS